jgi:hypothetical protein
LSASGTSSGLMLSRTHLLFAAAQGSHRGTVSISANITFMYYGSIKYERTAILFCVLLLTHLAGNRIEDKYFVSMGSYRRGGRSSSGTKRTNGTLKANASKVYEHGRWTIKQSKENMPTRYNEFTLEDRINLPLLCM